MTKRYIVNDCKDCPALWLCLSHGPPDYEKDVNESPVYQIFCQRCKHYELIRYIELPNNSVQRFRVILPKQQACAPYDTDCDRTASVILCEKCLKEVQNSHDQVL